MNEESKGVLIGVTITLAVEVIAVLIIRARFPAYVRRITREAIVDEVQEPLLTPGLSLYDSTLGPIIERGIAKALKL